MVRWRGGEVVRWWGHMGKRERCTSGLVSNSYRVNETNYILERSRGQS